MFERLIDRSYWFYQVFVVLFLLVFHSHLEEERRKNNHLEAEKNLVSTQMCIFQHLERNVLLMSLQ